MLMLSESPVPEPLARLYHEIECVDRSIVLLLAARLSAAQRTIELRAPRAGHITDRAQERETLNRIQQWARELGLPRRLVDNLFRSLLEEGKTRYQAGVRPPELPTVTVLLAAPAGSEHSSRREPRLQLVPVPSSR